MSVKINDDGTYDVSVHVADVSFFVKPNTALDRDARKRATSVYLIQRAVPMLPPALSEQLCSLLPGEERLAFTVTFTITKDAKILKKWFGKTIIKYDFFLLSPLLDVDFFLRSGAKLTYADAQIIINGSTPNIDVVPEHDIASIARDVKILHDLTKQLRERRFQTGCLKTDDLRLEFKLDDDGLPVDCWQHERTEAHNLIEEVRSKVLLFKTTGKHTDQLLALVHGAYQYGGCSASCSPLLRASSSPSSRYTPRAPIGKSLYLFLRFSYIYSKL